MNYTTDNKTAKLILDIKTGRFKAFSNENTERANEALRAKFNEILPQPNSIGRYSYRALAANEGETRSRELSENDTHDHTVDYQLQRKIGVGVGMRDVAISKIRSMVKNGELTNINIIKLLEIELKTSLSE